MFGLVSFSCKIKIKMRPYSIILFTFLQLVTSAPAPVPDITYNPTKEAPCTVTWDLQTNGDATEHYEVNGHCMFTGSLDRLCSGGYVAPGFCPNGIYIFTPSPFPLSSPDSYFSRFWISIMKVYKLIGLAICFFSAWQF